MKNIVIGILLFASTNAIAEIETDKKTGNCVAYFAAIGKDTGMRAALSMADNQKRAMRFAESKMDEILRYKNDKSLLQTVVTSANGDCRDIGITPSQY